MRLLQGDRRANIEIIQANKDANRDEIKRCVAYAESSGGCQAGATIRSAGAGSIGSSHRQAGRQGGGKG